MTKFHHPSFEKSHPRDLPLERPWAEPFEVLVSARGVVDAIALIPMSFLECWLWWLDGSLWVFVRCGFGVMAMDELYE